MYLVGKVYNFCTYHQSLTGQAAGGRRQTPAMAAGRTARRWSMRELLEYRVPLPRWQPPKQRGRRSKAMQELIERWAACPRLSAELPLDRAAVSTQNSPAYHFGPVC